MWLTLPRCGAPGGACRRSPFPWCCKARGALPVCSHSRARVVLPVVGASCSLPAWVLPVRSRCFRVARVGASPVPVMLQGARACTPGAPVALCAPGTPDFRSRAWCSPAWSLSAPLCVSAASMCGRVVLHVLPVARVGAPPVPVMLQGARALPVCSHSRARGTPGVMWLTLSGVASLARKALALLWCARGHNGSPGVFPLCNVSPGVLQDVILSHSPAWCCSPPCGA